MRLGGSAVMRLDPNSHSLVVSTAFMVSLTFAIFAMNVIALVLERVYG
jgi:hypothetical protein